MKKKITVKEVAKILQVEESTVRFWEKEFADFLNIRAERGTRNRYTQENLELFGKIKELLHTEMYTIKGARRRLELDRTVGDSLGVDHNFKTTVLFMYSTILEQLGHTRKESLKLAKEVQELRAAKSLVEDELNKAKNTGIISFFKAKINKGS